MNLTREDIIERLREVAEILGRVNIYINNILALNSSDLKDIMPEHQYKFIIYDYIRLLSIDINKLILDNRNEKLNFHKLINNLNNRPFNFELEIHWEGKFEKTIEQIKSLRDKKFAHFDFSNVNNEIDLTELSKLILDLNSTFNEICKKFDLDFDVTHLHDSFNIYKYFISFFEKEKNHSS
ncbi:hypothetical protein HX096_05820 [Empedobacter falsenii]|uniref:hypothetical protein n=1 Tax=Empedobacter falsenii TaxID=343874 RepID=UPI0025781A7E|nr:hypothetical protein [Empedobacter falsenii]MDM1547377.1 hypothetical protein [Empedobacter falsenii]